MGPFSLNLLLVLLLLLPGLVTVVAIYQNEPIQARRRLPGSGSLSILAVVPFAALTVHLLWALIFWINAALAEHVTLIRLPFDPNPYRLLLDRSFTGEPSDAYPVFVLTFLLATAVTPLAIRKAANLNGQLKTSDRTADDRHPDEEWLSYLIRLAEPENRYLLCYVLTKFGTETERVGYVGTVEAVRMDTDGEVLSLTLDHCDTFIIRLGRTGLEREQTERRRPLRYLTLRREEIINTSFEVQEVQESDGEELVEATDDVAAS